MQQCHLCCAHHIVNTNAGMVTIQEGASGGGSLRKTPPPPPPTEHTTRMETQAVDGSSCGIMSHHMMRGTK
jgi:hypothetical protein